MIYQIYLALLVIAVVGTAGLFYIGSQGGVGRLNPSARLGIVLSAGLMLLWGLLAIESFEITVIKDSTTYTREYTQLAWLCVAGAGISLFSMIQASFGAIKEAEGF